MIFYKLFAFAFTKMSGIGEIGSVHNGENMIGFLSNQFSCKNSGKLLTLVFWVVALMEGEGKELVFESPMLRLRHWSTDCKYG